jgi:hypothetical protein
MSLDRKARALQNSMLEGVRGAKIARAEGCWSQVETEEICPAITVTSEKLCKDMTNG